jgi:L-ornithine N5-monooxygenase
VRSGPEVARVSNAGKHTVDRPGCGPGKRGVAAALNRPEVELLAIGAGPSNLALAVAVEELAPADIARNTLIVERHENVAWQRGMLLPWTQSQVSFLKDLVTLRNPRSEYSFVNYLHSVGRLNDFINMAHFLPFRIEISNYLTWVAQSLGSVRIEYGRGCTAIEPERTDGSVTRWLVQFADGSTIVARDVVIGVGREPHIPPALRDLPRERLIHSSEYSLRSAELDPQGAHRVVVVGAAQSAAEMLWETYLRMPRAQCTMVMRSVGLNYYQTSKFTNELYFPAFTDDFFAAPAETRRQVLQEMHTTNYAGVTPDMLEILFQQVYLEKLNGRQRLKMVTMVNVSAARMDGPEVVLTLANRMTGRSDELRCDVVMLGTGFDRRIPPLVSRLAATVGVEEPSVNRSYRMNMPESVTAGCYLQGTNEDSHGIADSLMSVLAVRAGEIVTDLLARRSEQDRPASLARTAPA